MNVKKYKSRVAALGCLICGAPSELHHPRFCCGMSQRQNDWLVVPLCEKHHRTNSFGHAVHNGTTAFESNYMREPDMVAEVIRRLI